MIIAYNIAECIVGSLEFSVTNQVFLKNLHRTCFFPQESQASAPAPVGEDVPRASLCSVQSAPPKPATSVRDPLGIEKCLGKVTFFLPCTFRSVSPACYFILTKS